MWRNHAIMAHARENTSNFVTRTERERMREKEKVRSTEYSLANHAIDRHCRQRTVQNGPHPSWNIIHKRPGVGEKPTTFSMRLHTLLVNQTVEQAAFGSKPNPNPRTTSRLLIHIKPAQEVARQRARHVSVLYRSKRLGNTHEIDADCPALQNPSRRQRLGSAGIPFSLSCVFLSALLSRLFSEQRGRAYTAC